MTFLNRFLPLVIFVSNAANSRPKISWETQEKTRKNMEFLNAMNMVLSLNSLIKFPNPIK
jgi:hypothetical protein